ncbi:MAG: GNAT family N-acetyltransferase [Rhodospirillales bacterium]|nr:GNAT family N-acetyltransferase [Rhodospirillales bacterium]
MNNQVIVRPYKDADLSQVRALFIIVNRLLAPIHLKDVFETYIASSLIEEIARISEYYGERKGNFWVAETDGAIVGMFGLEPSGPDAMELRRMYVSPDSRRQGIAGKMLAFAEDHCRTINVRQLDLSTSEIQSDALSFYRKSGYELVREEVAQAPSNKTIGGGVRRFYFKKCF